MTAPALPARARRAVACVLAAGLLALGLGAGAPSGARADEVPKARRVDDAFFGMHVRFSQVAAPGRREFSVFPWIPFGSLRVWNSYTSWYEIEPERGRFDFRRLDMLVDRADALGARVLVTLGRTPGWASSRPDEPCGATRGCAAEPKDLADWDDYVRAVATRYRGRVEGYEIWNEPAFADVEQVLRPNGAAKQYFTGRASVMVEMTRRAAQVIRAVDPAARIVSPAVTSEANGVARLEAFMKAGGGRWVDVIGYHFYEPVPEQAVAEYGRLRAMLARTGASALPVWDTETGYVIDLDNPGEADATVARAAWTDKVPQRTAAAFVARSLLLQASLGIERVYWFNWDHDLAEGPMGLSRGGVKLNDAALAWMRVRSWILGTRPLGCNRSASGLWSCDFDRGAHRVTIRWREQGSEGVQGAAGLVAEPLDGAVRPFDSGTLAVGQVPVAFYERE